MTLIKQLHLKLRQFLPTKLPINIQGLNELIDEVLTVNDIPDDPTYHHAIASAVMHLGPITHRKSKRYFAKSVRKSIANQVAFEKIQALREEEKKKLEQQQEVTPQLEPSDGPESQSSQNQVVS